MENEKKNPMWWKDGFYDYPIEGGAEITGETWQALLDGQSSGMKIVTGPDGYPVLAENGPSTPEEYREAKISEVLAFDGSDAVNSFTLNGTAMWLDKNTRTSLAAAFDAEQRAGRTSTLLWAAGELPMSVEVRIDEARQLVGALEVYAKDTYNITQSHIAAIRALDTIEKIQVYDCTVCYPPKLDFTL